MDRLARLRYLVVIAQLCLVARLVHLQLIGGAHYRALAEQNRLRLVPELPPRGLILDRNGRSIAGSQTVFRVAIVPQELEDLQAVLTYVGAVVQRPVESLRKEYAKEQSLAFLPATIVQRVPKDLAIRMEEERWRYPGLLVRPETVRAYPLNTGAAHLLGYLSQPTAEEVPLLKQYGVRPKQLVGRMGLERLLDHALQGRSGGVMVEINHRARQVRVLGRRASESGARVALTIDGQLSSLIQAAFGSQAGAAVVLDPETGAILAMTSSPSFPPEAFATAENTAIRRLLNDPQSPLMNRAAVAGYQPGSIMKLVTAAAALEQHVVTPATVINCPGSLTIGDRTIHCWNRDGHGPVALRDAITQSCNVYFMQLARRVRWDRLRAAQEQIGLAHRTGWPMEEHSGHLPRRRLSEGEVALMGIGQGEILVTPLQAAVLAGAFANGGWIVEPWIVQTVGGRTVPRRASRRRVGWSAATLDTVRTGMRAVVTDPAGTGRRALSSVVTVAGKTGTAQTNLEGQNHGWFVGYCPVDAPKGAFAIIAEYGGSGGDVPADIARTVCEYLALPGEDHVKLATGR